MRVAGLEKNLWACVFLFILYICYGFQYQMLKVPSRVDIKGFYVYIPEE